MTLMSTQTSNVQRPYSYSTNSLVKYGNKAPCKRKQTNQESLRTKSFQLTVKTKQEEPAPASQALNSPSRLAS